MTNNIRKGFSFIKNTYVFLFAFSFLLTIAIEKIHHGTWNDTWKWINDAISPFMFNYLIVLSFCFLVSVIIGNIAIGFFVSSIIMLLLTTASVLKCRALGQPLLPWDLALNKEGLDISRYVIGATHLTFVLELIFLLLVSFACVRSISRPRISMITRMAIASLSIAILYALAFPHKPLEHFKERLKITEIYWDQNENYKKNGLFMSFITNMRHVRVSAPASYNEKNVKKIVLDMDKTKKIRTTTLNPMAGKPNIIIVMSEAFWDPSVLSGISFKPDPLSYYHSLQKLHTSGSLYSPQYGGGTANVEFEVLTGHSTDFLPQGSIPYQHFIRKPISSMARMLTDQGYQSIAIHSYNGWFWSRNKVYPLLGFEKFISSEGFSNPELKGNFIDDQEVSRAIISHTEQNPSPLFVFAVTMQNHGPYNDNRYQHTGVKLTGNISKASREILETYAQGVADADKSLETLVRYYQRSKEPTILVFFGDHLPMLGENYSVYTETKYITTNQTTHWTASDYQKMRNVPVLIWSNFNLPKEKINSLPMSYLGPYLLDAAQLQETDYFHFLNQLSAKRTREKITPEDHAKHWLLQYDQLFGNNYLQNRPRHGRMELYQKDGE